jgi:hypothetical protein
MMHSYKEELQPNIGPWPEKVVWSSL